MRYEKIRIKSENIHFKGSINPHNHTTNHETLGEKLTNSDEELLLLK